MRAASARHGFAAPADPVAASGPGDASAPPTTTAAAMGLPRRLAGSTGPPGGPRGARQKQDPDSTMGQLSRLRWPSHRQASDGTPERTHVLMNFSSHLARTCVLIIPMLQLARAAKSPPDAPLRLHLAWLPGAWLRSGSRLTRDLASHCGPCSSPEASAVKITAGSRTRKTSPATAPGPGTAGGGPLAPAVVRWSAPLPRTAHS